MYAIVEINGFQYRAEKNAVLRVPYLKTTEPGNTLTTNQSAGRFKNV